MNNRNNKIKYYQFKLTKSTTNKMNKYNKVINQYINH